MELRGFKGRKERRALNHGCGVPAFLYPSQEPTYIMLTLVLSARCSIFSSLRPPRLACALR